MSSSSSSIKKMSENKPFFVDRAKGGRANCKGCKGNCPSGELRLAKVMPSPYNENQTMKSWHHVDCFMNALLKQRPATKRVDSIDDIGNWDTLSKEDQEFILKKLNETEKLYEDKNSGKYKAKVLKNESQPKTAASDSTTNDKPQLLNHTNVEPTDDNKFSTFSSLCKKISRVDAYTEKTATVNNFFRKGTKDTFKGDLALWCKFLLPQVTKRVYNLKSKQLIKLFSRIFNADHDDMLTHLEQGDVADTIQQFFTKSKTIQPASESTLSIHEVENFLEDLSKLTREDEQIYHFKKIIKKCTKEDLKMLIRLIKGDLRINAGPKHILGGVHPDAYTAFQTTRDLNMVLQRVLADSSGVKHKDATQKTVQAKITLMTPVLPMLAEACKSVEMAMKKCPNGMFSEIKYDGERVQVHKKGNEFKYFSRSLKPVMAHKVSHFKDYLPKAFPEGVDMILDAEVLMVDVNTGKPLPFGTLGIHKKTEFKGAQVCLYVFDCLYYNGKVLIDVPIRKRRKILHKNMVEVTNHVMFSEQELIQKPSDLAKMIAKVLQLGLEGLVLKDLESMYEPGKRHWLKVKKDYLFDGAMADTADLVVLGAWYGTGKKGGMMSVFLMGCLDNHRKKWVTVTKVHTGHDDATLDRLQKELHPLMLKISQDFGSVPSWLDCNKGMVPDFVARDPKDQPVWEITGTELTKANLHTADGISVRFPRVTRIRTDKSWDTATNLDELRNLYKTSKEKTDVSLLTKLATESDQSNLKIKDSPKSKNAATPKKNTLDRFISIKSKIDDVKSPRTSTELDTSDEIDEKRKKRKRKIKEERKDEDDVKSEKDDVKMFSPRTSTELDTLDEIDEKRKKRKRKIKEERKDEDDVKSEKDDVKMFSPKTSTELDTSDEIDEKRKKRKRKVKEERKDEDASDSATEITKRIKWDLSDGSNMSCNTVINNLNLSESMESKNSKTEEDTFKDKSKKRKKGYEIQLFPENPFPDIFIGKRLGFYPDFISFSETERFKFERHWIAYGGEVVKSVKNRDVHYLVHVTNEINIKDLQKLKAIVNHNIRHVNKNWIIDCIKDVALHNPTKYPVFVTQ